MWIRTTIAIRNLAKEKTMAGARMDDLLDLHIATSMTTIDHGTTIHIREKAKANIKARKEKVMVMTQRQRREKHERKRRQRPSSTMAFAVW